jgi:hypothetical protein
MAMAGRDGGFDVVAGIDDPGLCSRFFSAGISDPGYNSVLLLNPNPPAATSYLCGPVMTGQEFSYDD